MQKVIDTVLQEPKTEYEKHSRWMNRMTTQFMTAPYARAKRIEIKYIGKLPEDCTGAGRKTCEKNGEHSIFNHSMDTYLAGSGGNGLPEGAIDE